MYHLLLELVGIPGVSPSSDEENRIAGFIYNRLSSHPWFCDHPDDLKLLPLRDDPHGRHLVFGLVRAPKKTDRTVIMTGHMDVVSTEACGTLRQWAFDPEEYTRRIGDTEISDDARKDLDSGEWLFGRGVSDMKCGVAAGITLLEEAASDPGSLDANLAVLYVPDEENNSAGMLSAAEYLAKFQKEMGLRYLAIINTEPTFATGETAEPAVYLGSIGKINPFFMVIGKETHVGEYYEGLCAAPIVSHINTMLDGNPDYSDTLEGKKFPPFGCMRQTDLRREYSATIMTRAMAFYSYLTSSKYPGQILDEMRDIAMEGQNRAIDQYERFAGEFLKSNGSPDKPKQWKPKVMTFAELHEKARNGFAGDFDAYVDSVLRGCPAGADERVRAVTLAEALVDLCGLTPPLVIIGFLPPWYPHRVNTGTTDGEKLMLEVADYVASETRNSFGKRMQIRPLFEGVSDLSYCGFQGGGDEIRAFADNMPGWGRMYPFPEEALLELDIPVMNLGPLGKDAHKNTERIHLPYSLNEFPQLLRKAVRKIAKAGK